MQEKNDPTTLYAPAARSGIMDYAAGAGHDASRGHTAGRHVFTVFLYRIMMR
jgi:hypothetical protein